jgi:nicotinate-nucleotide adenylyltransferase
MTNHAARRIGIFGGSFDPPHRGHRVLADTALASLTLDELRWIPAGAPWQKSARVLAPAADRAAMVALAIAGEPRFLLDERELHRAGPSYTIDTVRELQTEQPAATLYLLIGQDQYARLHTWHRCRELLARVRLAVAARAGETPQPPPELAPHPHHVDLLPMPRVDVTATEIRRLAASGGDLGTLVAPSVARYIDQHRLYQGDRH